MNITGKPLKPVPLQVLTEILTTCGLTSATVTSVGRTVKDQARVMFDNCLAYGVPAQLALYAAPGQQVVRVFQQNRSKPRPEVEALMVAKINELGPTTVSHHMSDTRYVFDVAPGSIPADKHAVFIDAVKSHPLVAKFLQPPDDPAYHLEIPINPAAS
jgi:hypothetical protein